MRSLIALGARERRALTIGAVTMLGIVLLGKGIPALHEWESGERAGAEQAVSELAALRRTLETGDRVRNRLARTSAELVRLDSSVLHSTSPAEAASTLAMLVNEFADSASIHLGAVTVRSDSSFTRGFATATVRATATGDVEGLMTFLQFIEDGDITLGVRELTVTQPDPAAPSSKPETLRFEVVIRALVRNPDNPTGSGR
jgi:hypothetical protein